MQRYSWQHGWINSHISFSFVVFDSGTVPRATLSFELGVGAIWETSEALSLEVFQCTSPNWQDLACGKKHLGWTRYGLESRHVGRNILDSCLMRWIMCKFNRPSAQKGLVRTERYWEGCVFFWSATLLSHLCLSTCNVFCFNAGQLQVRWIVFSLNLADLMSMRSYMKDGAVMSCPSIE